MAHVTLKKGASHSEIMSSLGEVTSLSDRIFVPTFLPGLEEEHIEGIPLEIEQGKFWRFALYWKGVSVGDVSAEIDHKGKLCLETL